jgi:hypothetical protein
MSANRFLQGSEERRASSRKARAYQGAVYLLLTALMVLIAACQSPPAATEQWLPPYLQLRLDGGRAQVQWPGTSEWTTMAGRAIIVVEEAIQIGGDVEEGTRFYLGDGSTLELAPEAIMEVKNPRTLPRLQMILRGGSLLFVAQAPSYEFLVPVGSVTLLSIPSRVRIEIDGETTRLGVEEGAVACALESETLTIIPGWEMYARAGEEPEVTEFVVADATASPATPALSPTPTPRGTTTPSSFSTSMSTGTPVPTRGRLLQTPTPTPVPPTDTPLPPPPPPPPPQPTEPPPPPTSEPPPAPTSEPPPPPTEPPPPPPTESRPTPVPPPPPTSEPPPPPPPTSEPPPAPTSEPPPPPPPPDARPTAAAGQ